MSDYGVDVPEWEALPWSWAAERLIATRNYWVITVAANPRVALTNSDSIECVSVQGSAVRLTDMARIDTWVERYIAKYEEMGPDAGDFIREHACFEVTPTLALTVIERPDEFALRATRWRFDQ